MRFKGFEWKCNPEKICFECDKKIIEKTSPFYSQYVQNIGRKNMRISGEGYLCGSDCMEQFGKLLELFKSGGEGVLAIANFTPVYAFFEGLKIIGEPKPNILKYSFAFRENMETSKEKSAISHICKGEECLWDVSYLYGIDVEKLIALNSFVRFPDEILEKGVVIKLC